MRTATKGIKPYGDTLGDGAVQVSFTLPLDNTDFAREAGKLLALKMGLKNPRVTFTKSLGMGFTFLILYGESKHILDLASLKLPKVDTAPLNRMQIQEFARTRIGRKIVILGACSGTDAHTVGIDAILNIKGYAGHKGLESYPDFDIHNIGSQVDQSVLVEEARRLSADALLVSQVVTQKDIHHATLARLVDLLEAGGERSRYILVAGGPGVSHPLAKELGFDAGFGSGTIPEHVASFVVQELARRMKQ